MPELRPDRARQVCAAADALRLRAAAGGGGSDPARRLPYFPEGGAEAVGRLLCALPLLSSLEAVERRLPLAALRNVSLRSAEAVRREVEALLPSPSRVMRYALLRVSHPAAPAAGSDGGEGAVGCHVVCTFAPVDSDGVLRDSGSVSLDAPCGGAQLWHPGLECGADGAAADTGGGAGVPSAADVGVMGVGQLKAFLASRSLGYAHLLEKHELRALAMQAVGSGSCCTGATNGGSVVSSSCHTYIPIYQPMDSGTTYHS